MLKLNDLCQLLADYAQLGYMQAIKAYEPVQDLVRENDVRQWLKINGIDYKEFKKFVDLGLIKRHRNGTGVNSPFVYSKVEIQQIMGMKRIGQWLGRSEVSW